MQWIPPHVLAAHYADDEEETPANAVSVPINGGLVPPPLTVGYPPQIPPIYNPAVPIPPSGWQVPPRPQPWYPQQLTVSISPGPMGYPPQLLFPVQNVRPPLRSIASPALQVPSPGIPSSVPSVPVSQPLFPVVNNNLPQISPFSAPLPSSNILASSPAEIKGAPDVHSGANVAVGIGYQNTIVPGNSHSYASGPNTSGSSIGPPPVIANKALSSQTNEVYLVWDDEPLSMEEKRMSLSKYQVHS